MNSKIGIVLVAIGLIASLGIATCYTCINLHTVDRNGDAVSGARVYLEAAANMVGETNATGYLLIPLNLTTLKLQDTSEASDNLWNISATKGNKWGYYMIKVPPGTCQNVTMKMT